MSAPAFFTSGEAPKLHAGPTTSTENPPSGLKLEYLNEGGANFVFRILPNGDSDPLPPDLQGQLLRLRKDLPHVPSAKDQLAAYDDHFKPLFPSEYLIQHTPIELHSELPGSINAALKDLERPSHRLQDFLPAEESHGTLITDMTPGPDDILLQVKPKWLAQSPNAPKDAKRCRTCALRAQRASQKVRTATDAQESCPLGLVSMDESERRRAAQAITSDSRLREYLVDQAQPLLRTLRDHQQSLDSKGVLGAETEEDALSLSKAMTVRDCTFFLKLSGDQIEARLADLDLKQQGKLSQWRRVEQGLIDEGWYTNSEDQSLWTKEQVCVLSRS
jgi:inositol-pentakisphosphate 2-kinase